MPLRDAPTDDFDVAGASALPIALRFVEGWWCDSQRAVFARKDRRQETRSSRTDRYSHVALCNAAARAALSAYPEARGCRNASLASILKSIWRYEEHAGGRDQDATEHTATRIVPVHQLARADLRARSRAVLSLVWRVRTPADAEVLATVCPGRLPFVSDSQHEVIRDFAEREAKFFEELRAGGDDGAIAEAARSRGSCPRLEAYGSKGYLKSRSNGRLRDVSHAPAIAELTRVPA